MLNEIVVRGYRVTVHHLPGGVVEIRATGMADASNMKSARVDATGRRDDDEEYRCAVQLAKALGLAVPTTSPSR